MMKSKHNNNLPPSGSDNGSLYTSNNDENVLDIDEAEFMPVPIPAPAPAPLTLEDIEIQLQGGGGTHVNSFSDGAVDSEANDRVGEENPEVMGAEASNAPDGDAAERADVQPKGEIPPRPAGTKRRYLWCGLACLLILIIIALVAIIGIMARNNNNNNDDKGTADVSSINRGKQEDGPTPTPSVPGNPTSQPTSDGLGFESIIGTPSSERLSTVSDCDDCAEYMSTMFPFFFRGSSPVNTVSISSNGQIQLMGCDSNDAEQPCGLIRVALGDMDPTVGGAIWVKHNLNDISPDQSSRAIDQSKNDNAGRGLQQGVTSTTNSMTVSWENVAMSKTPDSYVQVQATLYETGDIELCFGSADIKKSHSVRVSVQDLRDDDTVYPPDDDIFGRNGSTRKGEWPTNECMVFTHDFVYQAGRIEIADPEDETESAPPANTALPEIVPTQMPSQINWPISYPSNHPADHSSDHPINYPTGYPFWFPTSSQNPVDDVRPVPLHFQSMIGTAGAYRLATVSFCGSCSETMRLPFAFNWLGYDPHWSVTVLTDGALLLNSGEIRVASANYNGMVGGEIWAVAAEDYAVVSWEGMPLSQQMGSYVYAQAWLYPNGIVDICYGAGHVLDGAFSSGLYDSNRDVAMPAIGFPFDDDGVTRPGNYPPDGCQRFLSYAMPADMVPTQTPSWVNYPSSPPPSMDLEDDVTVERSSMFPSTVQSLSSNPDAWRLESASGCEGCYEEVYLPFEIYWLNQSHIPVGNPLYIMSEGLVDFCNDDSGCFGSIAMSYTPSMATLGSDVFVHVNSTANPSESSVTVSWENVAFVNNSQDFMNSQLTVFANGTVKMCWGEGFIMGGDSDLISGIWDHQQNRQYAPEGDAFDMYGNQFEWPTNTCQLFYFTAQQQQQGQYPTQTPSWYPEYPTSYPQYSDQPANNHNEFVDVAISELYPSIRPPLSSSSLSQRLARVSSCDDCTEDISLLYPIQWMNRSASAYTLRVSSNGFVEVFDPSWGHTLGIVGPVSNDLDTRALGDIYVAFNMTNDPMNSSVTVGWENVGFYGDDEGAFVNTEVTMFGNGTVRMCWGEAQAGWRQARSYIEDYVNAMTYTAEGYAFDMGGMQVEWPTNTCQLFVFTARQQDQYPTQTPSSNYWTSYPTMDSADNLPSAEISELVTPNTALRFLSKDPLGQVLEGLQNCDCCVESVDLQIPIHWLNGSMVSDYLNVYTNGYLEVCSNFYGCFGYVAIIATDLEVRDGAAVIILYDETGDQDNSSVTVSWEDVTFYGEATLHAQLKLFGNGTIEMCWGDATHNFDIPASSLVQDYLTTSYPAEGRMFDEFGNHIEWPSNLCQRFTFVELPPLYKDCPTYATATQPWYQTEPFQLSKSAGIQMLATFYNNMTQPLSPSGMQIWTEPSGIIPEIQLIFHGRGLQGSSTLIQPNDLIDIEVQISLASIPNTETTLNFRLLSMQFGTMQPMRTPLLSVEFTCSA